MPFEAVIAEFAAALENPAGRPPAGALGRLGAPDVRRFSVYRNNVAVSLIGALAARYPVTRRILGEPAFRDLARAFARARKPRSPVMIAYGGDFPDFLAETAPGVVSAGFVEVARLENAWVEAYHAADAVAATLADLAALEPGRVAAARVALHPAARLLRFTTTAASLWASRQAEANPSPEPLLPLAEGGRARARPDEGTHQSSDGGEPSSGASPPLLPQAGQGEDALITRPEADVLVRVLPPEAYDFALRLAAGATFAAAAEALGDPQAFGTHVVGLVETGAFASILPGDAS